MTRSVPDLATLNSLDVRELVDGYHDGYRGEPEPGDNQSLAYWHGWRCGASDGKHRPIDAEQRELARLIAGPRRLKPNRVTRT